MNAIPDKPRGKPKRVVVTIEYEDGEPAVIDLAGDMHVSAAHEWPVDIVYPAMNVQAMRRSRFSTFRLTVTRDHGQERVYGHKGSVE